MFSELIKTIRQVKKKRILVIGDVMIDHFIWGGVTRISPEAPTPVLSYGNERQQLGGAGFTAAVLAELDAEVELLAVCGEDRAREDLLNLLEAKSIKASKLIADPSRPTTCKQRLIAKDSNLSSGEQQILRVDYESTAGISSTIENEAIAWLEEHATKFDAIIASDYAKGMLSEKICRKLAEIAKSTCPVYADPAKGADLRKYKGFTAMKPNRHEAEQILGCKLDSKEDIIAAGKKLIEVADLDFTTISLDTEGIFAIDKDGDYVFAPTKPLEVYDVAGAGDSVLASLALFGDELPKRYLLEICNAAAGIMISQKTPKSINREKLIQALSSNDDSSFRRKVKSASELAQILEKSTRQQEVFFTNGYFDNISPNQILFLEKLSQFDGIRVVAINSDASIENLGHNALLKESDRLRLLQLFDCIDYIVLFDESDSSQLIELIQPEFFVKGANYKDREITEKAALDAVGAQVKFVEI